jgi:hypothetical protein
LHLFGIVVVVGAAPTDERRDALGRIEREVECDHSAERRADQRSPSDTGRIEGLAHRSTVGDGIRLDGRVAETRQVEAKDRVRLRKGTQLRLPHPRVGNACVHECDCGPRALDVEPDAHESSANRGRTNSSNVARSQLATVTGVRARTDAVRGMAIARATSPK